MEGAKAMLASQGEPERAAITFLGAAGTVTGSCTWLQMGPLNLLVDCGMLQGRESAGLEQIQRLVVSPRALDAVVLTHAHIDHSGMLPWLARHGYAGPIYATPATRDLCQVLLADAAHLQVEDHAYHRRHGVAAPGPLYTPDDVQPTMELFVAVPYEQRFSPASGMHCTFLDAGHILGAASCVFETPRGMIVFSGDIGSRGRPIIRDPQPPERADTLVMEATYGDREHPPLQRAIDQLAEAVLKVAERGGVCIIPVFAVGRCQTILYELAELMRAGRIPIVPVFLDSPLAIEAMEVFRRHRELYDEEALALLGRGVDPLRPPQFFTTPTVAESKSLNELREPAIILAGSGMCTGGRVRHHLRNRLPNEQDAVILVGYQAAGTLGRILLEGAEKVKLFGEWVPVRAEIIDVRGFSAHADQGGLLRWLSAVDGIRRLYINHSEPPAAEAFSGLVREELGLEAVVVERMVAYPAV